MIFRTRSHNETDGQEPWRLRRSGLSFRAGFVFVAGVLCLVPCARAQNPSGGFFDDDVMRRSYFDDSRGAARQPSQEASSAAPVNSPPQSDSFEVNSAPVRRQPAQRSAVEQSGAGDHWTGSRREASSARSPASSESPSAPASSAPEMNDFSTLGTAKRVEGRVHEVMEQMRGITDDQAPHGSIEEIIQKARSEQHQDNVPKIGQASSGDSFEVSAPMAPEKRGPQVPPVPAEYGASGGAAASAPAPVDGPASDEASVGRSYRHEKSVEETAEEVEQRPKRKVKEIRGGDAVLSVVVNGFPRPHLLQVLERLRRAREKQNVRIGDVLVLDDGQQFRLSNIFTEEGEQSFRRDLEEEQDVVPRTALDEFVNGMRQSLPTAARIVVDMGLRQTEGGDAVAEKIISRLGVTSSPTWVVRYKGKDHVFEGMYEPTELFDNSGNFLLGTE